MTSDNKFRQPLTIVALTIIILYLISFIEINYEFAGLKIRSIDIFSDIKSQEIEKDLLNKTAPVIKKNIQAKFISAGLNFAGSLESAYRFFETEADKIEKTSNYSKIQGVKTPLLGNIKQLSYFFDALKSAKSKTLRVAHFSDSAIEGDFITADIREVLQNKFGGNGVGWLGIVSQDVSFRTTTKWSFSDNWESASIYTSNPKGYPLGIGGGVAVPKGKAWVQYSTINSRRNLKQFSLVKLYYTNAKNSQINYSFDNGAKKLAALTTGSDIQELVLKPDGKAKSIKIEFPLADQAYFFGVSLENDNGVYVDNLPLRGNSGVDIALLKPAILKEFAKYLDYKLIILEFGLNIAGSIRTDYSWYEREMVKVINLLKIAFPKTSIVVVSVHDKSMKQGANFVTDPALYKLLQAQKNIAMQADVAFWSLFDAMGGQNSMPNWVNANPPLAHKDFLHFTDQGAAIIAKLLTDAILEQNK